MTLDTIEALRAEAERRVNELFSDIRVTLHRLQADTGTRVALTYTRIKWEGGGEEPRNASIELALPSKRSV